MILSDSAIRAAMKRGSLVIDRFDERQLGSNSYDVRLGKTLAIYKTLPSWELDPEIDEQLEYVTIPQGCGFGLKPGVLYLGVTEEYTETHEHVPSLDGKSSIGRLGISIHVTAGRGDVGFCGHWTMEIFVVQPVIVYPGMPIGQLTYFAVEGAVERPYSKKTDAKYQHGRQEDPRPQGSMMFKNAHLWQE